MAITFDFKDPHDDDQEYPDSCALLKRVTIDYDAKTAHLEYHIFKNKDKALRGVGVIGRKDITVSSDAFKDIFSQNATSKASDGLEKQCDEHAINLKDVKKPGQPDKSSFDGGQISDGLSKLAVSEDVDIKPSPVTPGGGGVLTPARRR